MEQEVFKAKKTVVGRTREELEKFGDKCAGYIGKQIVGKGEDAHLTTKVFLDLLKPHIILIAGKRGTGKSYSAGIIAEEIALLPEEFRNNLSVVMIDTMGIYWSLKRPNEQQRDLLKQWDLEPKGFENVKVFVPYSQIEEFEKAGIPVDAGISILPYEFSAEEWRLAFNLSATEPAGIALEKNVNELLKTREKFSIEDLITKIRDDRETSQDVKNALENMLSVAKQWGVFGEEGINIDEIIQPGQISVVDVSRLRATEAWSVRNFIVAILARKVYQARVMARKEEEIAKLEGRKAEKTYPMVWLIIDECLPGFSTILTEDGLMSLNDLIKKFEQGEKMKVLSYDLNGSFDYFDVEKVFKIKPRNMLCIETETGKRIMCTHSHQLLTKEGFIPAIVAPEIGTPLFYFYSKKRELISARILGHLFGDGWLESKNSRVGFSGEVEDLKRIKEDLLTLGFSSGKIYTRKTTSRVTTLNGKELKIGGSTTQFFGSTKVYRFFEKLGAPKGDKTVNEVLIPEWVMRARKEIKAEFLASLMGSDGYIQSPLKKSPSSFPPIRLSFNKSIDLELNAFEYAQQIKRLFEDLGIKISSITKRMGNIRKDGKKTIEYVITLSNSKRNLINFFERIGFRYCRKKEEEALKMLSYLKAKERHTKERLKLYKKVKKMQKMGIKPSVIQKEVGVDIRYWLKNKKVKIRCGKSFPGYKKWIESRCKGLILFEKVINRDVTGPQLLFDIKVAKVHNFIANGFIVHNCHNFAPADLETVSLNPLLTIAKQGREPGVGLVVITQMPNKIHQDILSQCDLVISHRLTSRDDLQALHAVMQTYMAEELWKYINSLPRGWIGSAIILDDNSERVFLVQLRPRLSWHAGGTAVVG